jgi:acyl dehydratase
VSVEVSGGGARGSSLNVGEELPPFVVEAVDPQRMKTMAALLDDPNPIHYDAELVRRLGYGDEPINQGTITMAFMMNVALGAVGPRGLKSFSCRFMGNVFAGERVECRGTVTAIDPAAGTAEVELTAMAGDRQVLAGSATVSLED